MSFNLQIAVFCNATVGGWGLDVDVGWVKPLRRCPTIHGIQMMVGRRRKASSTHPTMSYD